MSFCVQQLAGQRPVGSHRFLKSSKSHNGQKIGRQIPFQPGTGNSQAGTPCVRCHGLGDSFKDFMESIQFENWAPRSSRTWRLGQQPTNPSRAEESINEASIEVLNQRLAGARRTGGSLDMDDDQVDPAGESRNQFPAEAKSASDSDDDMFTRSTDEDVADALNRRIVQVAGSLSSAAGSMDGDDGEASTSGATEELLTGSRLRELVMLKYGKAHDFAFVRRDLPLGKTLVCLNIMYPHLGMRSFPMSEPDYMDKLDGIATYLRAWEQDEKVIAFLKLPPKPRKGLPARPIVGTAISIQLDLDDAVIAEWFPQR